MTENNEQLNYWLEDLQSLKKQVACTDVHFESISHYLIRIMNDSGTQTGMTAQKKRCIEKMQAYRNSLLTLMAEIRLLKQILCENLPEELFDDDPILKIPPQPSGWYWNGDTYTGIQRLTSLLGSLGNMSEQLEKMLNSMLYVCRGMCSKNNKNYN